MLRGTMILLSVAPTRAFKGKTIAQPELKIGVDFTVSHLLLPKSLVAIIAGRIADLVFDTLPCDDSRLQGLSMKNENESRAGWMGMLLPDPAFKYLRVDAKTGYQKSAADLPRAQRPLARKIHWRPGILELNTWIITSFY
ncbi:hypothetical protein B0H13DRAFT_1864961 [Mycena leptocephala]|nr:hypothetical protein B0H13DRAFT_1864961 [Mycena leptocephala]